MRIIGGQFKSRIIRFPKTKKTRPVTDRAKETIFNILGTEVDGAEVLDLFAGSGSFGLESISRGAGSVSFVDNGKFACHVIRANLENLGLEKKAQVFCSPVEIAIRRLSKQQKTFKLIFLDPPYNKGLIKKVLRLLDRFDIVTPFGKIIVGHSDHEGLPERLDNFLVERELRIGQSRYSFLLRTTGHVANT